MTEAKLKQMMRFLMEMSDTELYETGKLITHLVGLRHASNVLKGIETRPGKRGRRWKKAEPPL